MANIEQMAQIEKIETEVKIASKHVDVAFKKYQESAQEMLNAMRAGEKGNAEFLRIKNHADLDALDSARYFHNKAQKDGELKMDEIMSPVKQRIAEK